MGIITKLFCKSRPACSIGFIGGDDGPTSFFTAKVNKEKQRKFNEWVDNAAKQIKPCGKTDFELENYLIEKYNAKKITASDFHIKTIKANIIMNLFPELLTAQQVDLDINNKPTKKQMREFIRNFEKRRNEAIEYPIDKLNLDISVYEFPVIFENQEIGTVRVETERKTKQCNSSFIGSADFNENHKETADNVIRDIDLFRGVSQEDIDNQTPRFLRYAMALFDNN